MTSIKDFFKKKAANPSPTPTLAVAAVSPEKKKQAVDGESLGLAAKLKRSSKTLAKATPLSTPKRGRPLVIDDDSEEEQIATERAVPPTALDVRKDTQPISSNPSIPPPSLPHKSPDKAPAKRAKSTPPTKETTKPLILIENAPPSLDTKKSNFREYMQRKTAGPIAPGSKEIPTGATDCLAGLTFVFTGELESLGREEAQDLVKRYGGRVTSAPSGKTDYVIVGDNAGASKLDKIAKLNLKTLNEDALLALIRESKLQTKDEVPTGTHFTEEHIIKTNAKPTASSAPKPAPLPPTISIATVKGKAGHADDNDLWTAKYAPKTDDELIGNHSNYEKILAWLRTWHPQSQASTEKAILISGPPGIGKTTAATMACKEAGMEIVEMNASDTRSKSSLQEHVRDIIDNRSLAGFSSFFHSKENRQKPACIYKKQVLIMDEVDGMSSGDRGGMAELIQLIKRTKIPIICICNDRGTPKIRSLTNYCIDLRFRRPDARMVAPRILAIAQKEGLKLGLNTVEELVASTQGDIRQIINLLSTYRLTHKTMDFDQSKVLGSTGKKDIDQGPFDAVPALLGSSFDRMSLSDKIDQYFVDSSLVPLMVQENYLRARPNTARALKGKTGGHSFHELYAAAAESISEADLVESLIRGANQEWSLAPLHAVMSCVRPAYYCHGSMSGRVEFATWLGQNSKQGKNGRLLTELTRHSYLQTGSTKNDFRLEYLPRLAEKLLKPLVTGGSTGIAEAIDVLDSYTLTREDFDSVLEISLSPHYNVSAYGKVPAPTKTAFTRTYNQESHKLPYSMGTAIAKIIPDSELPRAALDGLGDGEYEDAAADDGGEAEIDADGDLSKDKSIKAKARGTNGTKKGGSTTSRGSGGRGRGRGK